MQARSFAGALAALLFGTGASLAAGVSVPELPEFEMTEAPLHPPAAIGAGARAKGVFVGRTPLAQGKFSQLKVLGSAADAAVYSKNGFVERTAQHPPQPCMFAADEETGFGQPWPAVSIDSLNYFKGSQRPSVVGVHLETMEGEWTKERGGSLAVIDAWLDLRSRGLKVLDQRSMPVKQVAEGPFGVRVFAARGADRVHFVVLPPVASVPAPRISFDRPLIQSGGEVGSSDCGHVRVTLDAESGAGSQATVAFQHVAPAPAEPPPEGEDAADPPLTVTQTVEVHLSASRNTNAASPVTSVRFHVGVRQLSI